MDILAEKIKMDAGRIEMAYNKKQGKLELKDIWYEPDVHLIKVLQCH